MMTGWHVASKAHMEHAILQELMVGSVSVVKNITYEVDPNDKSMGYYFALAAMF
jgi:hypothetical protein